MGSKLPISEHTGIKFPPSARSKAAGTWRQPQPFPISYVMNEYSYAVIPPQCFLSCYEWTFTSLVQFPQAPARITINKTQLRKRWMKNYRTLLLGLSVVVRQDRWFFQLLRILWRTIIELKFLCLRSRNCVKININNHNTSKDSTTNKSFLTIIPYRTLNPGN